VVRDAARAGPAIGLTLALTSLPSASSTWTVLVRTTFRSSRRDAFEVTAASERRSVRKGKKGRDRKRERKKCKLEDEGLNRRTKKGKTRRTLVI
jgi:hypothetical protein